MRIQKTGLNRFVEIPTASRPLLIYLVIIYATINAYIGVTHFDFTNYDDDQYVTQNVHVQKGLTLNNIRWAFTSTEAANWHPLTWISHMMDVQLFGLNPGGHHFSNLVLHVLNAILLLMLLTKMTGEIWKSAFVAVVFALHPLHVQSVAWVAERKDVLSAFFFLLTLWAYTGYCPKKNYKYYVLTLFFFICGLMSKPMLVTLPVVLLLMDYWPLQRFSINIDSESNPDWRKFRRAVFEKIPFLIFSASSCVITVIAQKKALYTASLYLRVANAALSYVKYIYKVVWPVRLAVFYPHPQIIPFWKAAIAIVILLSISLWAVCNIRKKPWLSVGWFWYLGTLVPVIGLVQVGSQAMADRYMYIPMTGLMIMVAWEVPYMIRNWQYKTIVLSVSVAVISIALWTTTWFQVRYWENSRSLFEHALAVTHGNYVAYNNLGGYFFMKGELKTAEDRFVKAIHTNPQYADPYYNLGLLYHYEGHKQKARKCYHQVLRLNPRYAAAYYRLGTLCYSETNFHKAVAYFNTALRIDPHLTVAQDMLHKALSEMYLPRH